MRFKLLDCGQFRQRGGVFYQMLERDERVRLAPAVVDGECAVRLVALSRQPQGDILDQFAQVVRGIGEDEELGGILVNRALTLLHHHVVQVGGKHR